VARSQMVRRSTSRRSANSDLAREWDSGGGASPIRGAPIWRGSRWPGAATGRFLRKLHPPTMNQARAYSVHDSVCSLLDCVACSHIGAGQRRGEGSGWGFDRQVGHGCHFHFESGSGTGRRGNDNVKGESRSRSTGLPVSENEC
jgi:hypothetical protein